jgi:group I intron endonuclease
MDKNGIIYLFENTYNGKCYIGKTTRTLKRRLTEHKYNSKNKSTTSLLYKSIQKYSWEAFDIRILENYIDVNVLDEREKYFIKKYNSYYLYNGYNLTLGGDGGKMSLDSIQRGIETKKRKGNIRHTQESRDKISNTMTGVKKSKEHAINISKGRLGWNPSSEVREKMSRSKLGNTPWNKGLVRVTKHINGKPIEIDSIVYKSAVDAAEQLNISINTIRYRLKSDSFKTWRKL